MRKLLFLLALISWLSGRGQTIQYLGGPTTQIYIRGQLRVDTVVYLPLTDTLFRPSQKGAVVYKNSNNQLYVWTGTRWVTIPIGSTAWGQITGTIASQTDLISYLTANYQPLTTFGYGLATAGSTVTYDSAHIRKVDTLYRLNDSTLQYVLNGRPYTVLLRGTAAGGISSLTFSMPVVLFNSPVTFSNTGGAWTGTATLATQNANTILAGPTVGSPATPTFRALVAADVPGNIPNSKLQNSLINLALTNTGTSPTWASSNVSLGGTATLQVPNADSLHSGFLQASDWATFFAKMSNYGNAPGWQTGSFSSLPAANTLAAGTHYTAIDSGFIFVDTGSGGTAGWKIISGRSLAAANPTGLVGLVPVNGTATTFMRSDAAPPLDTSGTNIHTDGFNIAKYLQRKDSGATYSPGYVTQASRQKLADSLLAVLLHKYDTGAGPNYTYVTWASRKKLADSIAGLIPGGMLPLRPGHIYMGDITSTARDTTLVSDQNTMQEIKLWIAGKGLSASDTATGYPAPAVDTAGLYYTTSGFGVGTERLGGWLTSVGHPSGDSIKVHFPFIVIGGNSFPAGHSSGANLFSGVESGNLALNDTIGQIGWRLAQLMHMGCVNVGWGGQTMAQIRNRFGRDFLGLAEPNQYGGFTTTLTGRPFLIILEGAINDFAAGRSVDSVIADVIYCVSMAQQYNVPLIVMNCPGDGGASPYEWDQIEKYNAWLRKGILMGYGARWYDLNAFWNMGNATGRKADNHNVGVFVNNIDLIHLTGGLNGGYDSCAKDMFIKMNLPVLRKMAISTHIDPNHGISNYAKPQTISITGYPTGSTKGVNTTYTLAGTSVSDDTINITGPMRDTAYITVVTSATKVGAGTQTGFSHIEFLLDNNPNNYVYYTKFPPVMGSRTPDLQGNTITLVAPTTNVTTPIMIRRNDGNVGLAVNTGNATNMILNNNGVVKSAIGGGLVALTANGGIATGSADVSQLGPTTIGSVSIGFSAASAPPAGNAIGAVGSAPYYGITTQTTGGYGNTAGVIFDNANGLASTATPAQSGGGGHSASFEIRYNQGDFQGVNDSNMHINVIPIFNQTLFTQGIQENMMWLHPNVKSLGSLNLVGYRNSSGNNQFNDTADKSGRTMIGTTVGDPIAALDVNATRRGFKPPRLTTAQRDSCGYIDSVYETGGSRSSPPTSLSFSGGWGSKAQFSISSALSGGNAVFVYVDGGYGYGITTPPTPTTTGGSGTPGTLTARLHGWNKGNVIYNLDSNALQVYNGTGWTTLGSRAIRYSHTIFAPSTGGTVGLVNNQYNIINPASALATLTVNLPSSPADNDVVYIKFTQAVTAVTYGNGTVVDGVASPTAGSLVVLTYDAATTSWY